MNKSILPMVHFDYQAPCATAISLEKILEIASCNYVKIFKPPPKKTCDM